MKPPRTQRRRARCVWEDGRGRCRRAGYGHPPLCAAHFRPYHFPDGERADPIDALLDHPTVRAIGQTLDERLQTVLDAVTEGVQARVERVLAPPPSPRAPPPRARPQRPRPRSAPPPEPPRPPPREDARVILGFSSDEPLSVEKVRKRRKMLATLFHTDAGGNPETMRRVNVAADELISRLS